MKLTLAVQDLKAVALFASTDAMRGILQGVLVECSITRKRLVATDGRTLGIIERDALDSEINMPGGIVIPSSAIKRALYGWSRKELNIVLLSTDDPGEYRLGDVVFTPYDKPYPKYRDVLIKKPSGEPGDYDPVLMTRFSAAAKILGVEAKVQFGQNGPEDAAVALISGDGGFYGLLSPITMTYPFPSIPDWVLADAIPPGDAEIPVSPNDLLPSDGMSIKP